MHEQKECNRRDEPQGFRNYHPTPPPRYELPVRAAQQHEMGQLISGHHCGRSCVAPGSQPYQNFPGACDILTRDPWNPHSGATGGNNVLSPPVSPKSQPKTTAPRQRDPRERSPARDQPVKAERHSQNKLNLSLTPDPLIEDGEITSSSMSITPRPEGPNRQNSNIDGPNYVLYGRPAPREVYTPNTIADVLARQTELFQGLERICTTAARTYFHSQCRSTLDLPLEHRVVRCARRRFDNNNDNNERYELQRLRRPQQQISLLDYLMRICSHLWTRATVRNEHAEELEAVHRMGNLYSWGERVMVAARGGEGPWVADEEEVYRVVMAGRDLCSWCLCEEGKREIDGLWEGKWVFGGVVLGGPV